MKIALPTWFPKDPATPRGGVEAVSVNLVRALAEIPGNDVHAITFDATVQIAEQSQWAGATIHRLPRPAGSLLGFSKGAGRQILQDFLLKLAPDVVHAHDTYGIMTRGLDLPRVFTIHGFIHEDTRLKGGWKARIRSALWKREEYAVWAEQPHIVSISPYVRERLRGIARGTIHDIENPIDPGCFEIQRDEIPGRIFSAAVIARRKNPLGLARAVASLPAEISVALRLAGPINEADYGRDLAALAEDPATVGRVRLLGSITSADVRTELGHASVFALVSFEEGAPMGIAEAMAAGVPILTSNRCGMPYMVRHGETGFLVDPNDASDIARQLEALLTNQPLRQGMGVAAREFALQRFHPQKVAARTLAVYRQALAEPAANFLKV